MFSLLCKLLVIRQKRNLKMELTRKLEAWIVIFYGKFGVFCFLFISILRFALVLLPSKCKTRLYWSMFWPIHLQWHFSWFMSYNFDSTNQSFLIWFNMVYFLLRLNQLLHFPVTLLVIRRFTIARLMLF